MNKYYNQEKTKIYNKRYREENKELIKIQKKQAYSLHAHNKLKNSVKVTCICGGKMIFGSLIKHMKSPKHIKHMNSFELYFA